MEKIELKPCPFCGGKALLHVWNKGIRVICSDCMCSTPSFQDEAWDDDGNYYDVDENKVVPCALIRAVKKMEPEGMRMDDKYIKFLLTVVVAVLVWTMIMLTVTAFYQMGR